MHVHLPKFNKSSNKNVNKKVIKRTLLHVHQLGGRAGPREGGQAIFPGKVKVEWDKICDAGQCLMFMNTNWIHVTLGMDYSGDVDDGADI